MNIAQFSDAGKMTVAEYRARREAIRATYGDTAAERTGSFDQELARLFYQSKKSGWTQEEIAKEEGKSQSWVQYRLRFGKFLGITTGVVIPKSLTEGRFRSYWERTDDPNEHIRFRDVARLMEEEVILSRPIRHKPAIANAIKATSAGGDWHRLATIVTYVQEVEKEATENEVKAVLKSMGDGAYNVFCEKKKGAEVYRIVIGGKQKIDLVTLKHELGPIIAGLKAEGKKNMTTASPGTVAHLTFQLEQVLDKLAHLAPE